MNLELQHGCGSFVTLMALPHSAHPIRNRLRNKHRNMWIGRCISSWWSSGNPFHVWYTYIPSIHCIIRNRASSPAAYFAYKLLCKSEYFTSSWYLLIMVCISISAFIHLRGWSFFLHYGLRLSTNLYIWFCNYSHPWDISALQYWMEYATLRPLCYIFSIGPFHICRRPKRLVAN